MTILFEGYSLSFQKSGIKYEIQGHPKGVNESQGGLGDL